MAPNTASSLPALPAFNPARLRSYLLRLPLFTRGIIVAIIFFWLLELQTVWSVTQWGSLIPKEIGLGTSMYLEPHVSPVFVKRQWTDLLGGK